MTTTNALGRFIEVSDIDADWDFDAQGLVTPAKFEAIKFFPGAADDLLVVKEGSNTGPTFTRLLSGDGEGRVDYEVGASSNPYIDETASTLSAGAIVTFVTKY